MPIAIVGTGRSGTSMVARMLNFCGAYLGEAADLASHGESNPRGFWENARLLKFNERLLEKLGATYENPARLSPGWEYDDGLDRFYQEAKALIESCFAAPARKSGYDDWGWKLPRATSTLAFWRRVIPDLKLVLCIRNPIDFAASVDNSHFIARDHALTLWQYYNLDVLHSTSVESRVVTFYEDYFPDYRRGLEPLLLRLNLRCPAVGSELDQKIAAFHEPGLKHHSTSLKDLISDSRVPYLAKELYIELLMDTSGRGGDVPILKQAESYLPLLHQALTPIGSKNGDAHLKQRLVEMEHRNKHLEQILSSRTHKIAAQVCDMLMHSPLVDFLRHRQASELAFRPAPAPQRDPIKA